MQVLKKNLKKLKSNPKKSVMGSVKPTDAGRLLRNVCGNSGEFTIGIIVTARLKPKRNSNGQTYFEDCIEI